MDKLEVILYAMIEEDDKKRNTVKYQLHTNIEKAAKKIKNLKLKDL